MPICTPCACLVLLVVKEGLRSLGPGIRGSCELLDVGGWELNLAPLEEQKALLTTKPVTFKLSNAAIL